MLIRGVFVIWVARVAFLEALIDVDRIDVEETTSSAFPARVNRC